MILTFVGQNLLRLFVILCSGSTPCSRSRQKDFVEQQARWAAEHWRRMKHEEQQEEKRKKEQEEIRKRMEEVDRKAAAERETDRERKREMARRAKEAGPEAIRNGKYPRCTQ